MHKLVILCAGIFLIYLFACFSIAYAESPAKPIELKVSSWDPAQLPMCQLIEKWGRMVGEKSGAG